MLGIGASHRPAGGDSLGGCLCWQEWIAASIQPPWWMKMRPRCVSWWCLHVGTPTQAAGTPIQALPDGHHTNDPITTMLDLKGFDTRSSMGASCCVLMMAFPQDICCALRITSPTTASMILLQARESLRVPGADKCAITGCTPAACQRSAGCVRCCCRPA